MDTDLPAEIFAAAHRVAPLWVMANTGDGGGVHIAFGHPDLGSWRSSRLDDFHVLARQLATAWRLRMALEAAAATSDARTASSALCDAVLREHGHDLTARTGGQALWHLLLAGHWTLVDELTHGMVRYVIAGENAAETRALRALSQRERCILDHALAGQAGKWIAYELGLSESVTARALRGALDKLGAADLAMLAGVRAAGFAPLDIAGTGTRLAVARLGRRAVPDAGLTTAERAVAAELVAGKPIAVIARERGTSPRTVGHQIANMYRKLEISSRRELLALLT